MKTFYVIFATIIVASIGFILYTQHETKKFIENIIQAPEIVSEVENPSGTGINLPHQTRNKQEFSKQTETKLRRATHYPQDVEGQTPKARDVSERENATSDLYKQMHPDTPQTTPKNLKKMVHYKGLATDQKIAKLREWLVKNYPDDMAEINEYLDLEKKIMVSLRHIPSQDILVLDIPIEEKIRHTELAAKFYPNNGHEKTLQSLQEIIAKFKSGEILPIDSRDINWDNVVIR